MELDRVAIIARREVGYAAGMLRGIADFARSSKPWLVHTPLGATLSLRKLLEAWQPSGVIAECIDDAMPAWLRRLKVPVVDVSAWPRLGSPAYVGLDHVEIGRVVAHHFLERGLQQFAYIGLDDPRCQMQRQGYGEVLKAAGMTFRSIYADRMPQFNERDGWRAADRRLRTWLRRLPKPVGVMLFDDAIAMWVTQACIQADVRVPEDVAIVGVFDNEVNCQFAYPAISSVEVPAARVGFEAARLLRRMMDGETIEPVPVRLAPLGVTLRPSSDLLAIEDEAIAASIRYIRANAHRKIMVEELSNEVGISRRLLEKRFRQVLGRSPAEEIRREHLARAKQLLSKTNLSLRAIALRSGFADLCHFSHTFKKQLSQTPGQYRKQHRLEA